MTSPVDERWQRAREAGFDACAVSMPTESESAAIECAIETATRVRVDHEIMSHVFPLIEGKLGLRDAEQIVIAAFRAAGFEVEE